MKIWCGKITKNKFQTFIRDALCYAISNLRNYSVVTQIHDDVVVEVPEVVSVEKITHIMEQTPPWEEGMELRTEGYECFYQKD